MAVGFQVYKRMAGKKIHLNNELKIEKNKSEYRLSKERERPSPLATINFAILIF